MDFTKIKKPNGDIELSEWQEVIDTNRSLKQVPPKKGINPFANEEVLFAGEGVAHYIEGEKPVGNICLEEGELLTTGVPLSICEEIATIFGAKVYEDDRS